MFANAAEQCAIMNVKQETEPAAVQLGVLIRAITVNTAVKAQTQVQNVVPL